MRVKYSKYYWLLAALIISGLMSSCKSVDLPSIQESEQKIAEYTKRIETADRAVKSIKTPVSKSGDMSLAVDMKMLNRIFDRIAFNREDDITLNFLPTKPLFTENASFLGVNYTNHINIEGGSIQVNLKKFRFEKFDRNKVNAILELEGAGKISVSGRYGPAGASANPEVNMYMFENIVFDIVPGQNGAVVLKPVPKKLKLKTKISISLLEWKLPWRHEITVELADIVKPIELDLALSPEISLPLPAQNFGGENVVFQPYFLKFGNSKVTASDNKFEMNAVIDFIKK